MTRPFYSEALGRTAEAEEPIAALDPANFPREISFVEIPTIKVIGHLSKTPWERFARLQRTAAKLAHGRGQPKGVFRFTSNEACTTWTANLNRNGK